ncbi:MAG: HDOD domain-containing protein [Azonexus sp.]|jgi:HD-like signal output (HDOD) protein|nr:HDOD domain-containing protein [Azonexus sp.]
MIDHRLPDIDSWIAFFAQTDLPVLRNSVHELERLRTNAETANGRVLAGVILHDPLLTLRVLAYIEAHRRERQTTDITTIDRAIMMIGITPFFRDFQNLPVAEEQLKEYLPALIGLLKSIARARRALHWARDWAILRRDVDVDEITLATLLHDVAELMMWLFAPKLALQVRNAQLAQPHQRSATLQEEIYGVPLYRLKLALTEAWRLPALLAQLLDHRHAENPRVRNVKLAVDLARHSADGWNNPALPDDFQGIRDLLHVSQEALVRRLDVDEATAERLLALATPG